MKQNHGKWRIKWGTSILLVLLCCLWIEPAFAVSTVQWETRLSGDGREQASDMALTNEGGLYVAGDTDSAETTLGASLGGRDAWIVRLDAAGKIEWQKRMGGSGEDCFTRVVTLADGGCLLLGTTNSMDGDVRNGRGETDAWVVRLDGTGEVVWTKCLGGTKEDQLLDVTVEEDTFVFAGKTGSYNGDLGANHGGFDAWACAVQADTGKSIWHQRIGQGGEDVFHRVVSATQGWLFMGEIAEIRQTGDRNENSWVPRTVAVMLNTAGEIVWQTVLGGLSNDRLCCVERVDYGWVMAGTADSTDSAMPASHGGYDGWFVYLREDGRMLVQRMLGGSGDEQIHAIYPFSTSASLLLGTTNSTDGQISGTHGGRDIWVAETTNIGEIVWQQALGGSRDSEAAGLLRLPDGSYLVAGTTASQDGDVGLHEGEQVGWLVRLLPNGNLCESQRFGGAENRSIQAMLSAQDESIYLLGHIETSPSTKMTDVWIASMRIE